MTTLQAMRPRAQSAARPYVDGRVRGVLLVCGIGSSLLYMAMNVLAPMRWPEYSWSSQTISELSAIDAPTRALWVPLGLVYTLLVAAFGLAVRAAGQENRRLLVAGNLIVTYALLGLYWPPMHLRGVEGSLTDTLHIAWSVATVLLMLLAIGYAAAALGDRFRIYSILTLAVMLVFGAMTGIGGPRVAANLPTPWLGLWERIAILAFMLWIVVLAVVLTGATTTRPAAAVAARAS